MLPKHVIVNRDGKKLLESEWRRPPHRGTA